MVAKDNDQCKARTPSQALAVRTELLLLVVPDLFSQTPRSQKTQTLTFLVNAGATEHEQRGKSAMTPKKTMKMALLDKPGTAPR